MSACTHTSVIPFLCDHVQAFEKLFDLTRDPSLTTQEVVQRYIMPATSQLKCRYCDLISDKLHDSPSLYVVHCWQMSFLTMIESVRQYVMQLRTSTEDVYIWLDVVCINQHTERTGSDVSSIREVVQVRTTHKTSLREKPACNCKCV